MDTYWQKQEYSKPLFEDLLWSRPVQKNLAGNLLILGGNSHAIAAPSEAFSEALRQGAGSIKVILPDITRKLLGPKPPIEIELAASTPSGSFSQKSIDFILTYSSWANALLFAGDFGRNSETAIVLEETTNTSSVLHIYTRDALDYFSHTPNSLLERENTLLVGSFAQFQKYTTVIGFKSALTYDMGLVALVAALANLTITYKSYVITEYKGTIIVAVNGKIITTKLADEPASWRLKTATAAAVWWLQNPKSPLEALATAITEVKY